MFSEPLRWAVREHSAALLIAELSAVWDQSPQGNFVLTRTSPDLRLDPYLVPSEAVAVKLHLKQKVICATWSTAHCDGTIGVNVRKIGGEEPNNFVGHARKEKPKNMNYLTSELVTYATADVQLVDGMFEVFVDVSIKAHVTISTDIFLAGYGVI